METGRWMMNSEENIPDVEDPLFSVLLGPRKTECRYVFSMTMASVKDAPGLD